MMPRLLCLSLALFALACCYAPFVTADDDDPEPPARVMSADQILKKYPNNKDAVEKLYLSTLRRKPTAQESARFVEVLDEISQRGADFRRKVFDDLYTRLAETRAREKPKPREPDEKK